MNTLFITLCNKVTICGISFSYSNMYGKGPEDLFIIKFKDEDALTEQCKLLDEYKFKYHVFHANETIKYPSIYCFLETPITYSVGCVKSVEVWMYNHDIRSYAKTIINHIENDHKKLTLICDEGYNKFDVSDLVDKRFPAFLENNKNITIDCADLFNVQL